MIAQIRAELLKIGSTRTTVGLILGMVALILPFTLLTGLLTHPSGLASKEDQCRLLSLSSTAGVFSALAGVLLVTSEYRYGTIRPTFLFNPARSNVLTAKVVVGALVGLARERPDPHGEYFAVGILGEAIGYVILDGRGITIVLTSSDVLLLTLGGLAGVALWGAIGVGVGAIIHKSAQSSPCRVGVLVVDNLLFGLVPSVGRFMPTRAADGLMGLRVHHLLSPGAGAIVLIAWAAALVAIGVALIARRDIN